MLVLSRLCFRDMKRAGDPSRRSETCEAPQNDVKECLHHMQLKTCAVGCSGEPSLMLVASVLAAMRQAVAAARSDPTTHLPAPSGTTAEPSSSTQSQKPTNAGSMPSPSDPALHSDEPDPSSGATQLRRTDQPNMSQDSFPGSFLGLEAPATVARVQECIGGPSIAAILRQAAGLRPAGQCSADDWVLV